jgi:hypothetical protein
MPGIVTKTVRRVLTTPQLLPADFSAMPLLNTGHGH